LLRFETLLSKLSARFVNLPANLVGAEIEEAQRRVCECLGFDLSSFWEWETDEEKVLLLTHVYRLYEGPPIPERMSADAFFPWCLAQLMNGHAVALTSTENAPPEAAVDLVAWRHFGIKTNVGFPLIAGGGKMIGVLSFCTTQVERELSGALIKRLELVAQVFTNAVLRQRFEEALRQSNARLSLAAAAAGAGLWSLAPDKVRFWVTDKVRELFGFRSDELVTFSHVLDTIHPEDRVRVQEEIDDVLASRRDGYIEYRISKKDGAEKWMASWGQVRTGVDGKDQLMGVTVDISERKEWLTGRQGDHTRIAATIELAGLGYYEMGPGMTVSFLDNRIRELIGITPEEEERGRDFWLSRIHPEDRPKIQETSRAVHTGECDHVRTEYRYLHPWHGEVWLHHLSHVLSRDSNKVATRIVGVVQDITDRKRREEELKKALVEVETLRDKLKEENLYLREQLHRDDGHTEIVGDSKPIVHMLAQAKRVAPTDSIVLITGETGTGKELLAQAIHDMSRRKTRQMIKVNCAALPAPLIEGELFGREKGAYTGAMTKQVGRFEVADGSTIFLDEIGDLPLDLQAKLLRVLQDGTLQRLGSNQTIKVNARVIAATNHDLAEMVRAGTFRADLYHRLNVFPIEIPSLRSRAEDIPSLVWQFVQEFNTKMGRSIETIPSTVMDQLKAHPWPGNVRELRNLIERAVIISDGRKLVVDLPVLMDDQQSKLATMEDVERRHMLNVLERTRWRISGKGGAAEVLGLVPTTLHSRMKKLGISRPPT